MIKEGGIKLVLSGMMRQPGNALVQQKGCNALWDLLIEDGQLAADCVSLTLWFVQPETAR